MSGPSRNPDKLNQIGVVVVGICGAVLVYVSIVALQAFYMDDTSDVQTMADYGGQDTTFATIRAAQETSIHEYKPNGKPQPPKAGEPQAPQTYHVDVKDAMKMVVRDAKANPSLMIPAMGPSDKPTIMPIFGRPVLLTTPTPAPAAPATGAAPAAPGDGSAAPPTGSTSAPMAPTGAGEGAQPAAGGGALPTNPTPAGSAAPAVQPMTPAGSGAATGSGSAANGNAH